MGHRQVMSLIASKRVFTTSSVMMESRAHAERNSGLVVDQEFHTTEATETLIHGVTQGYPHPHTLNLPASNEGINLAA